MWVVSWMESNSSSVSCIHMLCMCSLLSTSFKFSLCGCKFYTFSMFVALSYAFLRKILLFISNIAVSSLDAPHPSSCDLGRTPQHHLLAAPLATAWAGSSLQTHSCAWTWGASCWCLQRGSSHFRFIGRIIWVQWQPSPKSTYSGGL